MMSLLFLIPIALTLTGLMIWGFLWAVRSGQYDDLDRAGKEVLYDESHRNRHDNERPSSKASNKFKKLDGSPDAK